MRVLLPTLLAAAGLLLSTGCSERPVLGVHYQDQEVKHRIVAYINSPVARRSHTRVLTVSLQKQADTVTMEIANTYPDPAGAHILAHDTLKQYDVFFIGERLNEYYSFNPSGSDWAKQHLSQLVNARYRGGHVPGINYKTKSYTMVNHRVVKEEWF